MVAAVCCVLGVSVELSEAEVHWRKFLESLIARGLHGLKLIVSDNHVGLKAARMSVFPSVPWQRCQFHLQQNATAHIPRKSMQQEVHNDIRDVFNMPTRSDAEIQLKKLIEKYGKTAPDLSSWLENELPEGFTVFQCGTGFIECASEAPDNKYGGISKQGVEKTDKVY